MLVPNYLPRGTVPKFCLLSDPKTPRRATTSYSTNYYAPIAGLDQELDVPDPDLDQSLRRGKEDHLARKTHDRGPKRPRRATVDDSATDRPDPSLHHVKAGHVAQDNGDEDDEDDQDDQDDQGEFADEWKEFLAPESGETGINDASDGSDSEDEGISIDPEENEDDVREDFAAKFSPGTDTGPFLPKFLDYTAKLDKKYPTVESFERDNKSAIQDFETIVVSACRFVHEFTKTIDFKTYFKLPPEEQAISLPWAAFMGRSNSEILARTSLKAVPIQTSAALGRPDCTVQDLNRLPHSPSSTKIYGGYMDHVHKLHNDGSVEEYAYNGFSAPKAGAWAGRIVGHLSSLKTNYQDIDQNHQTPPLRERMCRFPASYLGHKQGRAIETTVAVYVGLPGN